MYRLVAIFAVAFSGNVFGQVVNIENRRVGDGTYGFSGALDMTLSAQQQKDLLVTVHFKPLIQYKFGYSKTAINDSTSVKDSTSIGLPPLKTDKNKHFLLLINDLKYTGGQTTYANFGMSHLRYAYRIGDSGWKWESYTQIQYNQLLLQRVRTLIGTGLRTKVMDIKPRIGKYDKRAVRVFMGTSLYYEYEEINYPDRPMDFNNHVRWSSYVSSYLNFKFFELAAVTYIQPNLATFKDYRFSGDYSLLFRISEPFSIKLNYSHFYDSRPPETVSRHIFSFSAGFVYRLEHFKIDKEKWAERKAKREQERKEEQEWKKEWESEF